MTAATFGCASARDVSIDRIFACAYGLRRIAACTMPGRRMSSRYVPLPRMNRASSLRFSRPKPMGRSCVALGRFSTVAIASCLLSRRRRVLGGPADRGNDVLVARAPADRARDGRADLEVRRVGVLVQERPRGHEHPGRAEPAVERVLLVEALLDR